MLTGVVMTSTSTSVREPARARSEPAGDPGRPDPCAGELGQRPEQARFTAAGVALCQAPAGGRQTSADSLPELGRGAELHRHPGLVQHAGRPAAVDRRAPRPRRARRFLDLYVHQLHPDAAIRQGPVSPLPPVRARHRRGRDARVHLRAGGIATSGRRSTATTSPTRSSRTTATEPGTPTRISTGRPSTTSTRTGRSATPTSARATTRKDETIVRQLLTAGGSKAAAAADDGERRSSPRPPGHARDVSRPAAVDRFLPDR